MTDPLHAELSDLLDALTPAERREMDRLVAADIATVCWRPHPENVPQRMAYESTADVVGFGGAAGGGKSSLLIGTALTRHRVCQIFRREGTELGSLVDEIAKTVGNRDGLRESPHRIWRNPTATCELIEFGSVPHPGDEESYRGRAKDFLGIDEATLFLESQVRFLMGWVRSVDPAQRCQTLLTFNPPSSPEGMWVIAYFAPWLDEKHPNPAKSGEIRWFAARPDGRGGVVDVEVPDGRRFLWTAAGERDYAVPANPTADELVRIIRPQSRTFIASRVTDNPYLRDGAYIAGLQAQPEPRRSQLLFGSFSAGMEDPPYQVIPTAWVDAAMARWKPRDIKGEMDSIGVDVAMGGKDSTVIARRHGEWFDVPVVHPGSECPDGPTIAGHVIAVLRDRAPIHIDALGVGAQPLAALAASQQQVHGINAGEAGDGVKGQTDLSGAVGFVNERSLEWWRMREALDPANGRGIALPPDRRLRADLTCALWRPRGNRIQVESRDEIVAKLHRSPDFASAYLLALIDTPKRAHKFDVLGNPIPRAHAWARGADQAHRSRANRPEADPVEYNPIRDF